MLMILLNNIDLFRQNCKNIRFILTLNLPYPRSWFYLNMQPEKRVYQVFILETKNKAFACKMTISFRL